MRLGERLASSRRRKRSGLDDVDEGVEDPQFVDGLTILGHGVVDLVGLGLAVGERQSDLRRRQVGFLEERFG